MRAGGLEGYDLGAHRDITVSGHPKRVCDISQAKVMAALVAVGRSILLPFGENTRYDLVIDEGGRFVRLQCKTGPLRALCGLLLLPTVSGGRFVGLRSSSSDGALLLG